MLRKFRTLLFDNSNKFNIFFLNYGYLDRYTIVAFLRITLKVLTLY